jgi:hypothetical protein
VAVAKQFIDDAGFTQKKLFVFVMKNESKKNKKSVLYVFLKAIGKFHTTVTFFQRKASCEMPHLMIGYFSR